MFKRTKRLVETFEPILGTTLEIQLVGKDRARLEWCRGEVLRKIPQLEKVFSVFLPDSELNRFSETKGELFYVSSDLKCVLMAALEFWEISRGAFHPMAGVLADVWREGRDTRETVEKLSQLPYGWVAETLRKSVDLPLNLNAVAKGFIIDELAKEGYLEGEISEVIINIGGDLRHIGMKGVTVDVLDPRSDAANAEVLSRVHINNAGFATSGRAMRPVMTPNGPVSHVFDPRTGQPVEHWAGVSVIAPSAMGADFLATALMVMKFEEGLDLVDDMDGTEFFAVTPAGDQYLSPGWSDYLR